MEVHKTRLLCLPCEAQLDKDLRGADLMLRKVAGGKDNKITCEKCGKRRYGAAYEIVSAKEGGYVR